MIPHCFSTWCLFCEILEPVNALLFLVLLKFVSMPTLLEHVLRLIEHMLELLEFVL